MALAEYELFAVAAPGLEEIVARELTALGVRARIESGGASFRGGMSSIARANLHLRTASRIVARVASFHATAFHELERGAKRVPWDEFLETGRVTRLRVTCRKSRLYHSDAVAQRIAAAIERTTGAPVESGREVDEVDPDADDAQLFVVRVSHDQVVISADTSGALLHRRGYRQAVGKAPVRETLAAAMVLSSGWTRNSAFVDPFCGSGTLCIEAALLARNIAPGLLRARVDDFAFCRWPHFGESGWRDEVTRAESEIVATDELVLGGSDRDAGAIEAAQSNAARAGVGSLVQFQQRTVSELDSASPQPGFVITNPPYGIRVGEEAKLRDLYTAFGRVLRERCRGWTVGILSPGSELESRLGIDFSSAFRTTNGGIPVRFSVGRVKS